LTILSEDWGVLAMKIALPFFFSANCSITLAFEWEFSENYLLKYFFIWKYIKIIFFYFLKIIFDINILKWFRNIKKILI
jgi:hypothetical protein